MVWYENLSSKYALLFFCMRLVMLMKRQIMSKVKVKKRRVGICNTAI